MGDGYRKLCKVSPIRMSKSAHIHELGIRILDGVSDGGDLAKLCWDGRGELVAATSQHYPILVCYKTLQKHCRSTDLADPLAVF